MFLFFLSLLNFFTCIYIYIYIYVCVCAYIYLYLYIKTLEQQYDHLTPILQIIQVRQARYCLGIKDKLISNMLLLITKHEHNIGRTAKTYFHQLCVNTVNSIIIVFKQTWFKTQINGSND